MSELHSDEWWMRVYEDDLSDVERRLWAEHLKGCEPCYREWKALTQLDLVLQAAPSPPPLPVDFTKRTVDQVQRKRQIRWVLSFVAGLLIVLLVAVVELSVLSSTVATLDRGVTVLVSGRQLLFGAFMRALVDFFVSWQTLLPIILVVACVAFLMTMPNSLLATWAFMWISDRQRAARLQATEVANTAFAVEK